MDEFDLIDQIFRPLATHAGAHGLKDDGASLSLAPEGKEWRITTDTLIERVHFRSEDSLDGVAWRALVTNISDLVAQLAKPQFYTLNLSLNSDTNVHELGKGFQHAQSAMGCSLLGGDTTITPGPLTISITAFGLSQIGRNPLRSKAKPGQEIGLLCAPHGPLGAAKAGFDGQNNYQQAYLRPESCLKHLDTLMEHSIAAMADVSDGLLQDLGHICRASGVGALIEASKVPVANPALPVLPQITWGDDYALIMTADALPNLRELIKIGTVTSDPGVKLLDSKGAEIPVEQAGYKHL